MLSRKIRVRDVVVQVGAFARRTIPRKEEHSRLLLPMYTLHTICSSPARGARWLPPRAAAGAQWPMTSRPWPNWGCRRSRPCSRGPSCGTTATNGLCSLNARAHRGYEHLSGTGYKLKAFPHSIKNIM